jgi:hypothetical protein
MMKAGSAREKKSASQARRVSKKDQILSLYTSGIGSVEDLAMITGARPSYVASVLQASGLLAGYFDLYTTTAQPMNVYSKFFAGKLGFKDEEAARHSVELIDRLYRQFALSGDRAGQHHALMMALVMFDRARWTGKEREADIFRGWLLAQLHNTATESAVSSPELTRGAPKAAQAKEQDRRLPPAASNSERDARNV